MKKLIFTLLLAALSVVGYAQVTPSKDTAILVFKPATLQKSSFVTTANSALYTPEVFTQASYTLTFKAFKAGTPPVVPPVVPPVIPPVIPPITPPGSYVTTAPFTISGVSNKVYSNLSIDCAGANTSPVVLKNCTNVSFINCRFVNSKKVGLDIQACSNITVKGCFFGNVATGIYPQNCTGGGLVFNFNQFKNMLGPYPRGQFVQLNTCSGPGDSICYNKCENILGSSTPEDAINLYMSNGTAASPIFVIGNWIRGGGPSKTGGGIMLGDNGGSFQIAELNILVDPGQYGMAIAGGNNIQILNNQVYAKKQSFTNIAYYVWNQSGGGCSVANVSGNSANFTNAAGSLNAFWDGGGCGTVTELANVWNASLDPSKMLPATIITLQ